MNQLGKLLFDIHTHAEIVSDENSDQIVYREKDVIELLIDLGHDKPDFSLSTAELVRIPQEVVAKVDNSFEAKLQNDLGGDYKRVWIGRGRYSLIVTLFSNAGDYKILVFKEVFHGLSQELVYEDVLKLVLDKVKEP